MDDSWRGNGSQWLITVVLLDRLGSRWWWSSGPEAGGEVQGEWDAPCGDACGGHGEDSAVERLNGSSLGGNLGCSAKKGWSRWNSGTCKIKKKCCQDECNYWNWRIRRQTRGSPLSCFPAIMLFCLLFSDLPLSPISSQTSTTSSDMLSTFLPRTLPSGCNFSSGLHECSRELVDSTEDFFCFFFFFAYTAQGTTMVENDGSCRTSLGSSE